MSALELGPVSSREHRSRKPGSGRDRSTPPASLDQAAAKETDDNLGAVETLVEFLATTGELSTADKERLIDQALILMESFFVHLPLKRAMHAIDPIQRLKLLRRRHPQLSERGFHDEMISIFNHLRDLHTNYVLPEPFRSRTAFVPFRIEEYFEGKRRRYVVTQVSPLVDDPQFKPGVTVTHWNNIPINRAVELNAEREAGSNVHARRARGVASMTIRWMGMSLPPDEETVTVRYRAGNRSREIDFDWQVIKPDSPATGLDVIGELGELSKVLGVDAKVECERRVLKLLFSPDAMRLERSMATYMRRRSTDGAAAVPPDGVDLAQVSTMPDVFKDFRDVTAAGRTFGYIRITTFNVSDDQQFLKEFIRLASQLSQDGLILDVRGNGGGLIHAGERLLQLLTPGRIEPCRLHFLNTPLTRKLCEANPFVGQWKDSIAQAIETGETFSQGFPLLPLEQYNDIGQVYQGPIVLVTDALCYSTTDIFAAGFQDHNIGKILGVSGNTGAGGANVWTHELLRDLLPGASSVLKPLPKGSSFRVAIRRVTRVGERMGTPIEDLGVVPDETHEMTRDDLLNGNQDLIQKAAGLLAGMTVFALHAEVTGSADGTVEVSATTRNVDRIDAYVDGRPRTTVDVAADGVTRFSVSGTDGAFVLELRGFQDDKLVAATRIQL
jgi:hypothetical protein